MTLGNNAVTSSEEEHGDSFAGDILKVKVDAGELIIPGTPRPIRQISSNHLADKQQSGLLLSLKEGPRCENMSDICFTYVINLL